MEDCATWCPVFRLLLQPIGRSHLLGSEASFSTSVRSTADEERVSAAASTWCEPTCRTPVRPQIMYKRLGSSHQSSCLWRCVHWVPTSSRSLAPGRHIGCARGAQSSWWLRVDAADTAVLSHALFAPCMFELHMRGLSEDMPGCHAPVGHGNMQVSGTARMHISPRVQRKQGCGEHA